MADVDIPPSPWCHAAVSISHLTLSHVSLSHTSPLINGVRVSKASSNVGVMATRQPCRCGRATLIVCINHTRVRLIGISIHILDLTIPSDGESVILPHHEASRFAKGMVDPLDWRKRCDGMRAFAGVLVFFSTRHLIPPRRISDGHGWEWMRLMHTRVFAFSEACEAACGLPRLSFYDTHMYRYPNYP
jgi:hypothetical protein